MDRTVYFFGGVHPIHESVLLDPPEGYKVISNVQGSDFSVISAYTSMNVSKKSIATAFLNLIKRPRYVVIGKRSDLIHAASGVMPLNRRPHVIGAEYYSSFVGLQHELALSEPYRHNIIKRLQSPRCKAILPFSEASKRSIMAAYQPESQKLEEKMHVLYPAIRPRTKHESESDTVNILHIGSGFFEKGGRELFKAVDILRDKHKLDVNIRTITNAPPHYRSEFETFISKYRQKEGFTVIEKPVTREILFKEFYGKSDIFALPSFGDFFGYVFLEAMACGLPLVGTEVFAIPEIIENGSNGFLVPASITPFTSNLLRKTPSEVDVYLKKIASEESVDMTANLAEKLRIMVEDKQIRKRMGDRSYELVESGKFSIPSRNRILKKVYDDALA